MGRLLVCCVAMLAAAASASGILIETAELAKLEGALPVDARNAEAFAAGHLPDAVHLDVESISETRDGVIGMLKRQSDLVPLFAAAGLDPNRTLVVYAGMEKPEDVKQATRLFWALETAGFPEVRLLNGGLAKWRSEGRPTASGASGIPALDAAALSSLAPKAALVADRVQVLAAHDQGGKLLVDLRSKADYTGASKRDFVKRAGHIPGASSKPATGFVEGEFYTFKSASAIREMIGSPEATGGKGIITYCNSGRDATVGYVAYRVAGFADVTVYDGSMAEWGNDTTCPVASGDE